MAIKACAPERSNLLRNREEMQIVLESLDEGYCHVTRKTSDLDLVGKCSPRPMTFFSHYNVKSTGSMGDIKVFATPGAIPLPNLTQGLGVNLSSHRSTRARVTYPTQTRCTRPLHSCPQTSCRTLRDSADELAGLR